MALKVAEVPLECFYKLTDRDGGTGLGLAITRRAVLDHGGQIDFETEEGRGTTFRVVFPVIDEAGAGERGPSIEPAGGEAVP
mgnify:CR=1 FL=1